MATATSLDDFDLIGRYTDQPARLPRELCDSIALATGEATICAYALIDLDARLRLAEQWLALTPGFVVLCLPGEEVLVRARTAVRRCSLERGLSCNTLRIELGDGESPLFARYTQRQRSAVERVIAALDGEALPATLDADAAYAAEVVRPIRNAQASVSRSGVFIITRLLRYLLPYRRQLLWG